MYFRRKNSENAKQIAGGFPYLFELDYQPLIDEYADGMVQIDKDEYETRSRMVELQKSIFEKKTLLQAEDYKTIKFAQGFLTEEEFAAVKEYCQGLRDEINAAESEYSELLEAHPTWTPEHPDD